ncbi:hypothetical protein Cs7R123_11870 [Catellatospora sp. TT07R-123]|uniref:DUF6458 family protein n=1 Tax=Catellatospora sp. TT07R-123 TaxID=2733863 RepID=UPI001B169AED|nr:DUF6458 family protein [Catellatospora sp. TT07R-123]GHJ43845.1 hypothetical protein Cs7R123_11870 [Catellatospora sp. TT07R-123]
MGIGASIFLMVLGAILAFAVDFHIGGLDIDVVGWILMIGGAVGLILTTFIWGPRRRAVVTREPVDYRVEERTEL